MLKSSTMAKETGDCEFWLPDDLFFGEDDFVPLKPLQTTMDSPDYFLSDQENPPPFSEENSKDSVMAGSPQSTLCANGFLSASGGESPNGPTQVSSPPPSDEKEKREKETLDMLFEAAGHVMRLKLNEEDNKDTKPKQIHQKNNNKHSVSHANNNNGFYSQTQKQIQAAQFHYLRQQQMLKQQQFTNALLWEKQRNTKSGPPLGLPPSAWPPLTTPRQQPVPQPAAGMRAVFLAGTKKESAGTGVFLPKRPGSPTPPRKKSGCSTVLLPARVVQALNLNLDELGAPARCAGGYVLDHDAMIGRSNAMNVNKKRVNGPTRPKKSSADDEICLPQEWTY